MKSHDLANQLLALPNQTIILSDENDVLNEITKIGSGVVGDKPDMSDGFYSDPIDPKPCIVLHVEPNNSLIHYLK